MSDKIVLSFELEKSDLTAFAQATKNKFEYSANQANRINDENDVRFQDYCAQYRGFSSLWLSCIQALLEKGKK